MSLSLITRGAVQVIAVALLGVVPACTAPRHPAPEDDVWHAPGPPPGTWESAVAFHLGDSTSLRVDFWDGVRTRTVSARDRQPEFGRSPWYHMRPRGNLSTLFRVSAELPGGGVATIAEQPVMIERGFAYEIYAMRMNPRAVVIGAQNAQSYPLPPALQRSPADSLWIYWGVSDLRGRRGPS